MTFETLTVIELLLSSSNYPEDKCDKIREELSAVDKKAKAWEKYLIDVRERIKFSENTEEDIEKAMQEVIDNYMEDK